MDMEKVIEAFDNAKELVWLEDDEYTVGYNSGIEAGKNITLALLKEQEPVKPVNVRWEMNIRGGTCPKCLNWVQRSYNYCPFCGKAVKW